MAQNKKISISQQLAHEQITYPIIFQNPFTANANLPATPTPKLSKSGAQRRNSTHSDQFCVGAREGAARLVPYVRGQSKLTTEKASSINYGFIEVTSKDEKAARNKQEKRRELRALQRNLKYTNFKIHLILEYMS